MRQVLLVQLARFGDLLQSKRLLLSLTQEAETQVHLCVDRSLADFAAHIYPETIVHSLPAHATQVQGHATVLHEAAACFSSLSSIPFDAVYTLNASPLTYALARLFPPEIVAGYKNVNGQAVQSKWLKIAFRRTHSRMSTPLNLSDIWAYLAAEPIHPEKVNPVATLKKRGRLGIVLAGRDKRRSLPVHILAKCLQALFQARGGPQIILLGTKADRVLCQQLFRQLPAIIMQRIENYAGKTELSDLPELLDSIDCLVTPDTGLMHLAAHVGVPVLAFFLSSAWCFETGPYGLGHTMWQATPACAPCVEFQECPHNLICCEPFQDTTFLAHLSGKSSSADMKNLNTFSTLFDELGITCRLIKGNDPLAQARKKLRSGFKEFCLHKIESFSLAEKEDFLFQETDWMLP